MKNRNYSETKAFQQFGQKGKNRKPFELLRKSQMLSSVVLTASSKADKNYRLTVCQEVHHYTYDLIHVLRKANSEKLGTDDRKRSQAEASEYIERLYDLIPVLRMCRCITPGQEGEIEKLLCEIRYGFEHWIESDKARERK